MIEPVFIEQQHCVSASGPTSEHLLEDYERARRPLDEFYLTDDTDFGRLKAGRIANSALNIDEDFERTPNSVRFFAGLEELISQVSPHAGGVPLDAVLIAHGRVKHINPLCAERDLERAFNLDGLKHWIQEQFTRYQIDVLHREDIFFVDGACSSGLQLVNMAWKRIRSGSWRRALLISFDPFSLVDQSMFRALGVLSEGSLKNSPHVFHAERDGFVRSEAFVATVLSSTDQASGLQIRSSAMTNDARSLTATDESGEGLKDCISTAFRLARLEPHEIAFVKGHGSGTPQSDQVEAAVLRDIFAPGGEKIPVVSFKSQFGHATYSSGLLELLLMTDCLNKGRVKAVPLSQPVDLACPIFVPGADVPLPNARFALGISMGFGGINSSLILERVG